MHTEREKAREKGQRPGKTIKSLKSVVTRATPKSNKNHEIWACQRFRPGREAMTYVNDGLIRTPNIERVSLSEHVG